MCSSGIWDYVLLLSILLTKAPGQSCVPSPQLIPPLPSQSHPPMCFRKTNSWFTLGRWERLPREMPWAGIAPGCSWFNFSAHPR